ncbi:hypothetical protein QTL86_18575 [Cellulosilyticum sp. ST5]|uniref:hypothetical protein n=1 Tax=Cellulosilyticum sp. ST5 TaxID=3055805 RepID=UPI00397781CF
MKYYKVKEISVGNTKEILIVECDESNKEVWIPSRLTDFIATAYSVYSLNTKTKVARYVTGFMNYLVQEVAKKEDKIFDNLKTDGLYGLNFYHLANYINHISNPNIIGNCYETVKDKEDVLLRFYNYLFKKGVTNETAKLETEIVLDKIKPYSKKTKVSGAREVIINPFTDRLKYNLKYPARNRTDNTLKNLAKEEWIQLIEYAEKYYPEIAFGVVIQCMGGLRQGEVVNLLRDDVDIDEELRMLNATIQDRSKELFEDRGISSRKSQIKKNYVSVQSIFSFDGDIIERYEKHLMYISKIANKKSIQLRALFIDARGNAMSGDVYEKKFNKLKRGFIEELDKVSPSTANKLKKCRWGSHIGRHIFTNYLLDSGVADTESEITNRKIVQLLRRDVSPESTDEYVDKKMIYTQIAKNIKRMSQVAKS